jgi:hypothetical protein
VKSVAHDRKIGRLTSVLGQESISFSVTRIHVRFPADIDRFQTSRGVGDVPGVEFLDRCARGDTVRPRKSY